MLLGKRQKKIMPTITVNMPSI